MPAALVTYGSLAIAVAFEVAGTSLLQQSQQLTRPWPTAGMFVCYAAAFYFLSITLSVLPVGIAYAIWSGLGIILISLVGIFLFGQTLDLAAIIGLGLIIAGVIVVNLFSNAVPH